VILVVISLQCYLFTNDKSADCLVSSIILCTQQFNFVGRILGPRGLTAKQLENDTGCKIMVRGKGSMRDKQKVSSGVTSQNFKTCFRFAILAHKECVFYGFLQLLFALVISWMLSAFPSFIQSKTPKS